MVPIMEFAVRLFIWGLWTFGIPIIVIREHRRIVKEVDNSRKLIDKVDGEFLFGVVAWLFGILLLFDIFILGHYPPSF